MVIHASTEPSSEEVEKPDFLKACKTAGKHSLTSKGQDVSVPSLVSVIKDPGKNSLREKGLILAHSLKHSPSWKTR